MSAYQGPPTDERPAHLRDIAKRIEPAFPGAADELRGLAAELARGTEGADRGEPDANGDVACAVCKAIPVVCMEFDAGCCSACRATGGCTHHPDPTPVPSPVSADVEALAEALGCANHGPDYGICGDCIEAAERVLDSDWLAAHVARLLSEERERVATEAKAEALREAADVIDRDRSISGWRDCVRYLRDAAAAIARAEGERYCRREGRREAED